MTEAAIGESNDKFGGYLSLESRAKVLAGPKHVVTQALLEATKDESAEAKGKVLAKVTALSTVGRIIPEPVNDFIRKMQGESPSSMSPFLGMTESGFLAIVCGMISGLNQEEGARVAGRLIPEVAKISMNLTQPEDKIGLSVSSSEIARLISSPRVEE